MMRNVLPPSCPTRFFTFSKSTARGFFLRMILTSSKNRAPRPFSSLNPCLYPAIENAWQGKPPTMRSVSGMSSGITSWMSRQSTFSGKFSSNVLTGYESNSFAYSVSKRPVSWNPRSIPPTPAKKDAIVYFLFSSISSSFLFTLLLYMICGVLQTFGKQMHR